MKVIMQHDERDCGATCLSMIASHYGLYDRISKFREITKTDRNGTNIYGIVSGAKEIGLDASALSGTMDELLKGISNNEILFPFIAHTVTDDGMLHFVVVLGLKNNVFIIGDPGKGKCKISTELFSKCWSGYIITFSKTNNFQCGNNVKGGFTKFFSLLKGQKKILSVIVVLSLVISIISISGAFIFESVIDSFYTENTVQICEDGCTENHTHITQDDIVENRNILDILVDFISSNSNKFSLFFIVLIFLYLIQGFTEFFRGYLLSLLAKNIDIKLMLSYYNHIVDLPVSSVLTRNTGEYLSRFSDASSIREAVSGATLTLILDSVMAIACGVFLFVENKLLFTVSLIMVLLYAIVVFFYKNPLESSNKRIMENNAHVESFLKESIDGIFTIKANQAESVTKLKNENKFNQFVKSVFHGNVLDASLNSICSTIELVGIVIILWIGFGLVKTSAITIGALISFYALLNYFSSPIKNVINLFPMIQTAIVAAERLNDILDIEAEHIHTSKISQNTISCIKFDNVDFRYGNNNLTIKNLSFSIKKGEKIAIVGESGSGKTTLAKLLMNFYKPEKGIIYINGIDSKEYSSFDIRSLIAYVNQETFLFSDTVKNNLLLGNQNVKDAEIDEICKAANLDKFIQSLPFGYDTYLDENGMNLSGGQRQRLAIARALLRHPQLLILDEATSNLDSVTETGIKNTIFEQNKDLTCIIIAHRLNTIKNCDKIIVLDNGSISEIGTHKELIKNKGKYYNYFINS